MILLALFLFAAVPVEPSVTVGQENFNHTWYVTDIKPDVTAYELSKIMMLMFSAQTAQMGHIYDIDWDAQIKELGTAARHLKKEGMP